MTPKNFFIFILSPYSYLFSKSAVPFEHINFYITLNRLTSQHIRTFSLIVLEIKMPKFLDLLANLFITKKEEVPPGSIPEDLIRVNDWDGLYNYLLEVIKYYNSVQHQIEGFDKVLNKPNWIVALCQDLHEKVNQFRSYHSKPNIPLSVIYDKEEQATTQKDYLLKLALFCADLCVKG